MRLTTAGLSGAIAAVALIGASPPPHRATPETQRLQGQQTQLPTLKASGAGAQRKEASCRPGQDDRTSDLCAQWKSADAANRSADWTRLGVLMGLPTLVAAGVAAWYAGQAAAHTAAGSREAKRSANVAVEMQRPWIRLEFRPTGRMRVGSFGNIYVPMEMRIVNEGSSPAQSICYGEEGATHPHDDAEYDRYWPRASKRAAEQAESNRGITVFPGREVPVDFTQYLIPEMTTEDGQFTFTFGVVVTYCWEGGAGSTKATGQLICLPNASNEYLDSWRFNLPALQSGVELEFEVQRREFSDEYS